MIDFVRRLNILVNLYSIYLKIAVYLLINGEMKDFDWDLLKGDY